MNIEIKRRNLYFRHNGNTKYTQEEGIFQEFLEENQALFHRTIEMRLTNRDTGLKALINHKNTANKDNVYIFRYFLFRLFKSIFTSHIQLGKERKCVGKREFPSPTRMLTQIGIQINQTKMTAFFVETFT